jgi:hypothetical protein
MDTISIYIHEYYVIYMSFFLNQITGVHVVLLLPKIILLSVSQQMTLCASVDHSSFDLMAP